MPDHRTSAIVVGAGVGGLSLAAYLAQHGCDVSIFEQRNQPGGRCGVVEHGQYRFDAGATLLLMPRVVGAIFSELGEDMWERLRLVRLDPLYTIHFERGGSLRFSSDPDTLRRELERVEPGAWDGWLRYSALGRRQYDEVMHRFLARNANARDYATVANVARLAGLRAHRRHFPLASRHFRSPELRAAVTFQNVYVGQHPFRSSAAWASIPAMEAEEGAWYPAGGMHGVVRTLVDVASARGARLRCGAPVERITTNGHRATGVRLADGTSVTADIVAVNADLPYAYARLLYPECPPRRLHRMRYTSSAIVFHWGVKGALDGLGHHSIFVGEDYRGGFDAIAGGNGAQPPLSHFYVNRPAFTDATVAPAGHEALTVIVPAPHAGTARDWNTFAADARAMAVARLAAAGWDLDGRIAFEIRRTPPDWERTLNLTHGSVFGSLDHGLDQFGCLRPANRHPRYRNLYFAGGSTHPGSGVPLVMLSGRHAAVRIMRDHGIPTRLADACDT